MDELKSSYCGAIFGLPLLSSPGVVTGVLLSLLSTVVSADFGAVGFPSFDPDGMLGSPLALGSGVSAANADSPCRRHRGGNVSREGLFQRKEGASRSRRCNKKAPLLGAGLR
jgi:hypothetical protein